MAPNIAGGAPNPWKVEVGGVSYEGYVYEDCLQFGMTEYCPGDGSDQHIRIVRKDVDGSLFADRVPITGEDYLLLRRDADYVLTAEELRAALAANASVMSDLASSK